MNFVNQMTAHLLVSKKCIQILFYGCEKCLNFSRLNVSLLRHIKFKVLFIPFIHYPLPFIPFINQILHKIPTNLSYNTSLHSQNPILSLRIPTKMSINSYRQTFFNLTTAVTVNGTTALPTAVKMLPRQPNPETEASYN